MRAKDADERQLRELEERLLGETLRRNPEAVAALLAPGFVELGASGRVFGREEIVAALASEAPAERRLSDVEMRWLADDVALVIYRASRRSAEGARESLRSSIWQRSGDGGWQLVFHQGTPVP